MLRADACHIPFKDDSFAGAFGTLVFCSIENPSTAINELKRVVRHEGRIVLLEHVRPKEPLGTLFDLINFFSVRLIKDHFNRRTAEILYEHGLRIEEIRSHAGGIINIIVCGNLKPTITDG